MGLTTGFISGVTLTTGILYLSLRSHQRARLAQSRSLQSQALVLTTLTDPELARQQQEAAEAARRTTRLVRDSWAETAKDRWNAELEGLVRRTQDVSWSHVWEVLEGQVSRGWENVIHAGQEGAQKVEKQIK